VLAAAKAAGAEEIYVSEPIAKRRATAQLMGAASAFEPQAAAAALRVLTGYGPDVVFECAGELEAVRQSAELVRPLGKLMVIGIPAEDDYVFPASASRRKQLTVTFVRRSKGTTKRAIELAASGKVNLALLATHRFPLHRAKEAMELALQKADGVIRAIVEIPPSDCQGRSFGGRSG